MTYLIITARCARGHAQELRVEGSQGRVYADNLAGLLDGSSPWYQHPPGPESVIGKCGICGSPLKCEVTKVPGA